MINKERIELWVSALESGDYEQCTGSLWLQPGSIIDWEGADGGRRLAIRAEREYHCADGVAIAVALKNGLFLDHPSPPEDRAVYAAGGGLLPECVSIWYGLPIWTPDPILGDDDEDGEPMTVANANDAGFTFWDIAQMLRKRYLKEDIDGSE